ncbi:MAG: response regulator [Spirochaetales bacterium]|nr:response regulator [Spirochaetales bacterium]MCF7939372.1 response regulator [Spirochaetales bacterium]
MALGKRILIVEDEHIVALDIQHHLERSGFEVTGLSASGEKAIESVAQDTPDLVLMDIRLQGEMDGIEAADTIRQEYNIPVIMLTAYTDEETIERAKNIHPFGYLIKPFEERELKITIEMALFRHDMEEKLRLSEEKYRRFFSEDLTGDFFADADGTITECNASFSALFGLEKPELAIGTNLNDLFRQPWDREVFWERLKEKKSLQLYEMELQSMGASVSCLANVIGTFEENGDLVRIKGYLINITERKELERQLRQSQKMEAVGKLAGGIAHDFNNVLTIINGYTDLILSQYDQDDSLVSDIRGIQDASLKASSLTKQLLAFSKHQILNPVLIDLNKQLSTMKRMVGRMITDDIELRIHNEADYAYIYVDPVQIEQIVLNLAANARDAMPEGGRLVVNTDYIQIEQEKTCTSGRIEPGNYVVLQVEDSGSGMNEETIEQIFEPFFTTKAGDKGTGLGLSTVLSIVRQLGGVIDVRSDSGKGSAFSIYLPAARSRSDQPEVSKESGFSDFHGNETVLMVEDDDEVRRLVARILGNLGYTVLSARNGGEAILMAEQNKIDLLLSDIVMPLISGTELAGRIKRIIPGIRIMLMSGYPDEVLAERDERFGSYTIVQKPFTSRELAKQVRDVLDSD